MTDLLLKTTRTHRNDLGLTVVPRDKSKIMRENSSRTDGDDGGSVKGRGRP